MFPSGKLAGKNPSLRFNKEIAKADVYWPVSCILYMFHLFSTGGVISNLGKFLDHPSEEVQLAVVYVFILLMGDSDVDYLLMPKLQQQLTRAVILILSSSDHTTLLTTTIG